MHLRKGGVYRIVGPRSELSEVQSHLEAATDQRGGSGPDLSEVALVRALADIALTETTPGEGILEVTRRGRTLAKLREADMNVALSVDPSRGRIIDSMAAASFESRCELHESGPLPASSSPVRYDAPELFLREYFDVLCWPKSVVAQRGLLTPDSFRHHQRKVLRHMQLRDAGPRFAVAPARADFERLDGPYFHLDNEHRGFFGHALTEQLSRLWAWQESKHRDPDLRLLVLSTAAGRSRNGSWSCWRRRALIAATLRS